MSNLNFINLMNEIRENINKLKNIDDKSELYSKTQKKLLELNDLIEKGEIPKDVFYKVVKFHYESSLLLASFQNRNHKKR